MLEALAIWVLMVVVFLVTRRAARPRRQDLAAMDFAYNPMADLYHYTAETGQQPHWTLDDPEFDALDLRVQELETEKELLEAANAALQTQLAERRGPDALVDGTVGETTIHFKPEEPRRFADYEGQPHVTVPLAKALAALPPTRRVLDHKLFIGPAGLGKTLIAKVIGYELDQRAQGLGLGPVPFYWSFAANLNKVELLDQFVRQIVTEGRGGVWFIDEIHVLNDQLATKIYSLMEDGRYPFEGDLNPTPIPDLMLVGATTDYGGLHAALKRRFGEALMLRRLERPQLLRLVTERTYPIQDGAAELLVDRTHWSGAPWEALILRREAEIFATAAGRTLITEADVQDVFTTYDIDEYGLRWQDREVLRVLFQRPRYRGKSHEFVCFAASESDVCTVAGLDPEEYREVIRPRLLSRHLLEIRTGYGQALTATALERYGHLKPVTL